MKLTARLVIFLLFFALPAAGSDAPSAWVLAYSSYSNSTLAASDASGNLYVKGWTGSSTPPLVSPIQTAPSSIYLAKLDPRGKQVLFSTYFGGQGDSVAAIVADRSGNIYITGVAASGSFPMTPGAFQGPVLAGHKAVFIAKIDTFAGRLVYSALIGGSSNPQPAAIALDASGNAVVGGATAGPGIVVTPGALQTTTSSISTSFITKLNAAGSALVFSTYLGGQSFSALKAISLDLSGAVYATGYAAGAFPVTPGAFQSTFSTPNGGCFISKLSNSGSSFVYSTLLGGKDFSICEAIVLDGTGGVYVGGRTSASDFPVTSGAFQTQLKGSGCSFSVSGCLFSTYISTNVFVSKIDPTGSVLQYSTFLGGGGGSPGNGDALASMAIDSSGNIYLGGATPSGNFPMANSIALGFDCSLCLGRNGPTDAFISILDPTLGKLTFSTVLGGPNNDSAQFLVADGSGGLWIGGFSGGNFPITSDAANPGPVTIAFPGQGEGGSTPLLAHLIPAAAGQATPLPVISGTLPSLLLAGQAINAVRVFGTGFTPNSVLIVNGQARPTTVLSSTQLTAPFSTSDIPSPGYPVPLHVQTRTPEGYIAAVSYSYYLPSAGVGGRYTQLDIDVHDPAGKPISFTVGLSNPLGTYVSRPPYGVDGNGTVSLLMQATTSTNFLTVSAPGFQTASLTTGVVAGQETSVSVTLVPQGIGHVTTLKSGMMLDSGIDLKAGQTLILYAQGTYYSAGNYYGPDGLLGCISGPTSKLPHGGTCGVFAARIGNGSWFSAGPAFGGPVASDGRLFLGINEGTSVDPSTPLNVTVIVLDTAICTAEPSITKTLDPGFYIAEVRNASGTGAGYWGISVSAPLLAGGLNLGGSLQEKGGNPGFGAVYLESPDTIHIRVDAQPLGAGVTSPFGFQVRVLDANHNPLGDPVSGTTSVEFDRQLNAGFYVFEIRSGSTAPRATYQMGLTNAAGFVGGVNIGGFVAPGLVGFGAFYVPSAQPVGLVTYSLPHYDNVGASCVTLTLLDANRRVVATAP